MIHVWTNWWLALVLLYPYLLHWAEARPGGAAWPAATSSSSLHPFLPHSRERNATRHSNGLLLSARSLRHFDRLSSRLLSGNCIVVDGKLEKAPCRFYRTRFLKHIHFSCRKSSLKLKYLFKKLEQRIESAARNGERRRRVAIGKSESGRGRGRF